MELYQSAGLVNESNKEIIEYGLVKIYNTVIMWIFTIVCAWILGDFLVGVLFELSYMLLRRYAGGYHAKTEKLCLLFTYLSTLICIVGSFVINIKIYIR